MDEDFPVCRVHIGELAYALDKFRERWDAGDGSLGLRCCVMRERKRRRSKPFRGSAAVVMEQVPGG